MKAPEWRTIVKPLLPADQDWAWKGGFAYRVPFDRFIFGLVNESSWHDRGVYVTRVALPLFSPTESLHLTYSQRIGGGANKLQPDEVNEIVSAIREAIVPWGTDEEILALLANRDSRARNSRLRETAAYCQILLGFQKEAVATLVDVANLDADPPWVQELIDRAQLMLDVLEEGGLSAGVNQLDRWSEMTIQKLGLATK